MVKRVKIVLNVCLLSFSGLGVAQAPATGCVAAAKKSHLCCNNPTLCFTPEQLRLQNKIRAQSEVLDTTLPAGGENSINDTAKKFRSSLALRRETAFLNDALADSCAEYARNCRKLCQIRNEAEKTNCEHDGLLVSSMHKQADALRPAAKDGPIEDLIDQTIDATTSK